MRLPERDTVTRWLVKFYVRSTRFPRVLDWVEASSLQHFRLASPSATPVVLVTDGTPMIDRGREHN